MLLIRFHGIFPKLPPFCSLSKSLSRSCEDISTVKWLALIGCRSRNRAGLLFVARVSLVT